LRTKDTYLCGGLVAVETCGQDLDATWLRRHTRPMSIIDKQRIAAVRKLEAMGYVFHEHDWTGPTIPATFEADAMHAMLVLRADAIESFTPGSEAEREFALIAETLESYEAKRWPDGKIPDGKG
jgi:hypothetical protein